MSGPTVTASIDDLDALLSAQLIVAWAGEASDPPRLAWWQSNLVSDYGGLDFLRRLVPTSWRWAALRAVRQIAIASDRKARETRPTNADRVQTLFHHGFALDEALDDRLSALAALHPEDPRAALHLDPIDLDGKGQFDAAAFGAWAAPTPIRVEEDAVGRRLVSPPVGLGDLARAFTAALVPLTKTYPLPYITRA